MVLDWEAVSHPPTSKAEMAPWLLVWLLELRDKFLHISLLRARCTFLSALKSALYTIFSPPKGLIGDS